MKNLYTLFALLLMQTSLFATCIDGPDFDCDGICDADDETVAGEITLNFSNATETTIEIEYNLLSCQGISGFQFDVSGVDLISATDGNLTVQTANNNVIAFDMMGAQLPSGSGSLASLDFIADLDGATLSLSDIVIGSAGGLAIDTNGPGSADIAACTNYDGDDLCDIDSDDCISDDCGICDGYNASNDCNNDCSGSLSAGTWVNTNPGGAVDPSAPTTVSGSADDESWNLSPCVWLDSPSTVNNNDGTVTITSVYGSDADHACELSSGVFNGEVTTTNVSTHDVALGYAIVGEVEFTLSSANSSNFSVTSIGTFNEVGADYSLNGILLGGSSGGAVVDECGECGGDGIDEGACDCDGNVLDTFSLCGGDNTLQGAIDAANLGDTVSAPDGIYAESINISSSVAVVCEGNCTIDARGISGSAVVIAAVGATLDGFTISGDETMYAGVIVTPSCQGVTVSNNTISGMTLSNPSNDSPLSYGILAYGNSETEMPMGSTFSGNNIFGVAGAAISLGSYTYATTITGNSLHDIIPVDFLGEQLSTGVQSEFAGELNISGNTFGNLYIGTSLLASQGSVSGNTYSNVVSLHTATYPSYVTFNEDIDWWQTFSTVDYLGQEIVLVSYASALEYAILAADDGSTITDSDGNVIVQDCTGAWGGPSEVDECGECGGSNECQTITGLSAIGGLNEVMLQWDYNPNAASYNIYRDGELACSVPGSMPYYLDDGTCGDDSGWGLGYDTAYCYTVVANGPSSGEACATTLPQLQAFLDLDVSLANAEVAAVYSPFGDLTGDGVTDAVIMVNMVNFFAVDGYQFSFSLNPDVVDIIGVVDGTYAMTGGAAGLVAQLGNGLVMGYDATMSGASIPAGYPGDGGAEGNLLAVLVLSPQYSGPADEVAVTISDFVISGINPFTGDSVTLNACDADLDPLNGCFDTDTFSTPTADCYGIPAGSIFDNDDDGVCNDVDNCPNTSNPDQADDDYDCDGTPDDCDPTVGGEITLNFSNATETTIDIEYYLSSCQGISGFQFHANGIDLISATDGNLTVQTANNNVVAFDMGGAQLEPGSGSLASLEFFAELDGAILGLSDIVIGSSGGIEITTYGPDETAIVACTNFDGDDLCDIDVDDDDDNDGSVDADDSNDNDSSVCHDDDGDTCDECASGTVEPATNDGADNDGDGWCNDGDPYPDCAYNNDNDPSVYPEQHDVNPYDECGNCHGDGFAANCVGNDDCVDMACDGDCDQIAYLDTCGICNDDVNNDCIGFTPTLTIDFATPYVDSLSAITATVSQNIYEPEAFSSTLTTDGGSFEFYELEVGDNLGSGSIDYDGWNSVDYHIEVYNIISSAELEAVLILDSNFDENFGIGDAIGGYTLENTAGGTRLYTQNLATSNFLTGGYTLSFTLDNIFRCSNAPSVITATANLESVTQPNGDIYSYTEVISTNIDHADPIADVSNSETHYTVHHNGNPYDNTVSVVLDGSASVGDGLVCQWGLDGRQEGCVVELILIPGTYNFNLLVTDQYEDTSDDNATLTVVIDPEPNADPVSDAGADTSYTIAHDGDPVTQGISFALSGSASDADTVDVLTYLWIDGDDESLCTTLNCSDSVNGAGDYAYTLTTTDSYNASHTDTVIVTIEPEPNTAPVSDAGLDASYEIAHDGDPDTDCVTFDLAGSASDIEGDSLSYNWNGNDGGLGLDSLIECGAGDYTYTFTTTDSYNASHTDTVIVTVIAEPNDSPICNDVNYVDDLIIPHNGDPDANSADYTLCAECSDPDGDPIIYTWSNDSTGTCQTFELNEGEYAFEYYVTDSYGYDSDTSTASITLSELNEGPTADAGDDQELTLDHDGQPGGSMDVSLSGDNSSDPESDSLSYSWCLDKTEESWNPICDIIGDSSNVVVNLEQGEYDYVLTVADPYGESDIDTTHVIIYEEENPAPAADAGADTSYTIAHDDDPNTDGITFTLTGSCSDTDGDSLSYSWTDSDSNVLCDTSDCNVSENGAADYTYTLTCADLYGSSERASGFDDITVTVNEEPNESPVAEAGDFQEHAIDHDGDPSTNTKPITLDGSESADADGDALSYSWADSDGNIVSETHGPTIRDNDEYVASTGFGLGDYEASYQGVEGFVIANTFQLNLEYQAGVDSDAVDVFNNYGEGTVHNWMDPEYYVVTISEDGGLPAWSYSDLEEDVDADLQWTITGWGQTILGGSIEDGRLVVTTDYRPFDADAYVNNVEVFEGSILQEVVAYTFDGAASDIGAGTQLGVELRVDSQYSDNLTEGIYTYTLCVEDSYNNDDNMSSDCDDVSLHILPEPNEAPIADAGADTSYTIDHDGVLGGSLDVSLTGACADADNDITEATWSMSGDSLTVGIHTITLTCTDPYGATDTDDVTYTITEPNEAPTADAGEDAEYEVPHDGELGGSFDVAFAGVCADADSDSLTVSYSIGEAVFDGTNAPLAVGEHTVTLTCTDPYGDSNSDDVTYTIIEPNEAPTAAANDFSAQLAHDGEPGIGCIDVTLDCSGSSDPDSLDVLSYLWEPGTRDEDAATLNVCLEEGVHDFICTVTDPYGASDSDIATITIDPEVNATPVADLSCGEDYGPTIRDNDEYVASTGFGLGDYEASYQGVEGFVIANTFQLNLEYQDNVDNSAVDLFNNYGEGTVHNWMDPEYYVVTISEDGGLPAWSYSDAEEDEDADLQWTITGWGQTILGGSIEDGRLVVTTDYRPFDADSYVNNVEVFEGSILQEVIAYTFDGAASDIGAGTQLGVELRDVFAGDPIHAQADHTDPADGNGSGPDIDVATVTCSAGSTADPDEIDILQYNFIQISGSDVGFTESEDGTSIEFESVAGEYGFQVTVTDPYGATDSASDVAIIDIAENGTLTTDAGVDTSYEIAHDGDPDTDCIDFTLSGLADDHEGDALSCEWSDSDDNQLCTTTSCDVTECGAGVYTYTFECTDPYGVTASDDIIVIVDPEPNTDPTADAGEGQNLEIDHDGDPDTDSVTFTLTGSGFDEDGDELSYSWTDSEDNELCTTASCDVTENGEGEYSYTLTVTDTYDKSGSSNVSVTIDPEPNTDPTADAGEDASYEIAHDGYPDTDCVTFDLTGLVDDHEGDALTCEWSDSDGNVLCDTSNCDVVECGAGNYEYTLTCTDPYGASHSDNFTVIIEPEENIAPEIVFSDTLVVDSTLTHDGVPGGCMDVELDACGAGTDENGDDLEYDFSADNGFSENSDECSITAEFCEGSYTIEVCVTDSYGAEACDSYILNVLPEDNQSPVVECADFTETLPSDCEPGGITDAPIGSACSFNDADDTDGFVFQFSSCDLDSPAIVDFDTENAVASGLEEGQYCFTFRVTDNLGETGEDSFLVTVNQEDHGQPSVDAGGDETIYLIHDGDPTSITEEDVELCSQGSHSLNLDCALTYTWSNGSAEECTEDDFSITDEPTCLTVTVTDSYGQESSDEVCVTVIEENQDPVATFAVADTNHLVIDHNGIPNEGSTVVRLNGCGSNDPDNTIIDNPVDDIEFQWYADGDAIDGATGCTYDTELLEAGTHSYTLRVTDAYGAYNEFTGTFTTFEPNFAPIADAGADTSYTIEHDCAPHEGMLTITLNGLTSADAEGDIISEWVWKDLDTGETVCDDIDELCVFERGEGNPNYSLTITDIYGDSDTDTVAVTIVEPNAAPTADAGQNQAINEGETFILDATASSDPEGCELTYMWTCDGYSNFDATDSYIEITSNPEEYNPGSVYNCEVCVNDGYDYDNSEDGTSTSCTSIDITVNNINTTPVADAGPGYYEYQIPHDGDSEESYMISLDCSHSFDDDQDSLTYTWSDESGATVCQTSECSQNVGPGTYSYTCSIDDQDGGLDSDGIVIVVYPEENDAPTADIDGDNLQVVNEGGDVPLYGCNSYDHAEYQEVIYGDYYNDVLNGTGLFDTDFLAFDWTRTGVEGGSSNGTPTSGSDCDLSFSAPNLVLNTYLILNYELDVEDTYGLGDTQNATRVIMNENQSAQSTTGQRDGDNEFVIDPEHDCDSETFYADISLSEIYTDPDQDDLLFNWFKDEELICGDDFKPFNESGMETSCTVAFDAPGVYDITLAVKDIFPEGEYYDDPITVIEDYTITVNSETDTNNPPEADAGQAQEFKLVHDCVADNGISVNLDASASSDDIDDNLLTYKWILDGEVICDSDSPECTTDELLSGDHEFTLEVCDCYGACTTDQVMVTIEYEDNIEPTISVENDHIQAVMPHDGSPESNCFEIATEAYGEDADDDALTYEWVNPVDGSIESNTNQFAKQFCEVGSYEFEITVTDCYDASSTQQITIEVLPEENVAPIIFSMRSMFEACEEDPTSDLCNYIVSCNPGEKIIINGLNLVCDEDNVTDCSVPDFTYSGNSTDHIECTWLTRDREVQGCEIIVDCPEKDDLWNEFTMSDEELRGASYIPGYELSVTDPYQAYDGTSSSMDESVIIESPYVLDMIPLNKNANLISFNWLPDYTAFLNPHPDCVHEDCNGILSNVQGLGECEVSSIVEAGAASTYVDGQWLGSIVDISDEKGYWVLYEDYQACSISLDVIGIETDCEETVYSIVETAALISYVGPNNSPIEDAIHCGEDSCIRSILTNSRAAICAEDAWAGSLEYMHLGEGYWILKKDDCEDADFSWENCEDDTDNMARTNQEGHISLPENLTFSNTTSQAFYFINEITLEGVPLSEDKDWYILAYSNETIVGAKKWSGFGTDLPVMGYDKLIESSANYPKTGDIISIKLYNNKTGEIINMAFNGNAYPYASNQVYVINSVSSAIISPDNFVLGSSYPNPFNPVTTINFALPISADITLDIYNIQGRIVESLISGTMDAGYHSVEWNADNHSSGVYFVKMATGDYINTQKLILLK